MMDSCKDVQTKSSFLIPCASILSFDGNPTGGGKRQAFGILPDLALAWNHALVFYSLNINLMAKEPAKYLNPSSQKSQFHMAPQLAGSFKSLNAEGKFLLN